LSAAWRLQKRGFLDFVLLEMEQQPGGNSRWGENEISAYPWAAHYVPVPDKKAALVRELFEERRASVGANRKREPLPRYGGDVIPARQQPGDTEVSVLIHTRSSCPQ